MRSLLIAIVGVIAVLALRDVVVTGPEEQAPAAVRDPDRHFASRPDLTPPTFAVEGARPTRAATARAPG